MEHRPRILVPELAFFIILETVSLCILANNSRIQQMWLVRGFHDVSAAIWNTTSGLRNFLSLQEENDRLAEENVDLRRQLKAVRDSVAPPPEWKETRVHFKEMSARIVSMSRGSQHNYLVIDRGEKDGVAVNDGIMTAHSAVGIIQSVSRHFAYAVSFANQQMTVSAKAGRNSSVGSLCWNGYSTNEAVLSGIPLHIDINPGDTVFTSGFSSIFPPDIPLGIVESSSINNGSTADFTVRLLEDISSIHHVIVVKNTDRKELEGLVNE